MGGAATSRATPAATSSWYEDNQRYLAAALAEVRAALERHLPEGEAGGGDRPERTSGGDPMAEVHAAPAIAAEMASPPALERLCDVFGLSSFERDVLLLCAGVELEGSFADLCAAAQRDSRSARPTFGLAMAVLPGAHWSALAPGAPLRRWKLVEAHPADGPTRSPLHADERVLHYLTGVQDLDEKLVGFVQPVRAGREEPVPSHRALARKVAAVWAGAEHDRRPLVELCGAERSRMRAIARAACDDLGLALYRMDSSVLPAGGAELDVLARLWTRESVLAGAALLLDAAEAEAGDPTRAAVVRRFAEEVGGPLVLATPERLAIPGRATLAFDIAPPTRTEQHRLWTGTLGPRAATLNGQLDRITAHFDLNAEDIRAAGLRATTEADGEGDALEAALWSACRIQARQRLEGHARCLEPRAKWDDLVLPEAQRDILRAVETHVRHRLRVHESWGFAARSPRGLGITALFSGASGTGKTLAAEVLAHTLGLDLYHVDLSAVVSKYIGETEKNLRRVFDAAESGGAVLLFDEADALFGKRSEVKDSHDRYANVEVSYLLQRMESYRGLAILTTNLKDALDEAFDRRIRFRVNFPFPGPEQRADIWRRVFPPETPTEGLHIEKLSRLDATGGTIRKVALHAAFLAAEADTPVRMTHVRDAVLSVYGQLEKSLTDGEIRGWA